MATQVKRDTGTGRRLRVGALVAAALLVLILSTYQVGRIFNVFSSRYELVTLAPTAAGLRDGAAVTLAGQRVGQIESIRFIPLDDARTENRVSIALSIDENVQDQIRADSRAFFRTQGLLGDKFIDISPGTPRHAILAEGDTLVSAEIVDLETVLETASMTLDSAQAVIGDVRLVTGGLARGEGTIGRMLEDDALYDRMVVATGQLAALLGSINRSEGTLGRIIRDPTLYNQASGAIAQLDTLTATALHGDGTIGKLLRDDQLYARATGSVASLDSSLVKVNALLTRVTEGDGTIDRLLSDPALYEGLLKAVVDLQTLILDVRANPQKYKPNIQVDVF